MNAGGNNVGGSWSGGNQQGGGQHGNTNPTSTISISTTSAQTSTTAAVTTTSLSASASASASASPPSDTNAHSNNKAILIGSAAGGVTGLLFTIFLLIWYLNRRSKSKEKRQQAAAIPDKENGTLLVTVIDPTIHSGLSRSFIERPRDNPNELPPQPLYRSDRPLNSSYSGGSSIASGGSADNLVMSTDIRDRGMENGRMYSSDREDLLPPTYADSQTDIKSMRVRTPQHPHPSTLSNGSLPYTSRVFSTDSLGTEFYNLYDDIYNPYQHLDGENGYRGLRVDQNHYLSEPVSPLSSLGPLQLPNSMLNTGTRPAATSLESLIRGPGGLLARSLSGMTVSTVSGTSVATDGDLREMGGNREIRMGGRMRGRVGSSMI